MTFILTMVIFIITANESHIVYEQSPLIIKSHIFLWLKKKSKSKAFANEGSVTQNQIHSVSMY